MVVLVKLITNMFLVAIKALNPSLKAFAPVREWAWSRENKLIMQLNIISLYQSTLIHLILSIKSMGQSE